MCADQRNIIHLHCDNQCYIYIDILVCVDIYKDMMKYEYKYISF